MENIPSIDLNSYSLANTPHKVEEYSGQKVFYSQNWIIDFSSSNNEYKSPLFSEKSDQIFTIFFLLSFNDDNKVTLSGYLVEQKSYQIVKVFFQIGNPYSKNTSKNDLWSFNSNKNSNITVISSLEKYDLTSDKGWLDENKKLNIYFEISYYNNPQIVQQNLPQQPKLAQDDIAKKMQQTPGRIGLINMNSMCYINSFLQVLFHIPEFRQILFSVDTSKSSSQKVLIQTQFLFYMMENSNSPWSADDLAKVIPFCSNQRNNGKQQDALEFAMNYLDDLEKDLRNTNQQNAIKDFFFGLYEIVNKCKNVDFKTTIPEPFMSVNIPVYPPENEKVIQELNKSFKQYISKSEFNYKTDQYGIQLAERWTQFINLPPVLQICFLRSTFDLRTSQLEKQMFPISFPNTLFLYYLTHETDDEYRLYAVISHDGGGDCGHYCVFIRDLPGKKWFKYNDSTVSEVTKEDAIKGNFGLNLKKNPQIAYILYYVRKTDEENLFKTVENSGMSPQMKNFMESLRLKKLQEEYEKNNVYFKFILEEKLNSKSSIDDLNSTLSDKSLKIQKSESRYALYHKVADLFQRNIKEIRLWLYDTKAGSYEFIAPKKSSYLSNLSTNLIFIQYKKSTEKLSPNQKINQNSTDPAKVMVFLKYFDTRLKLPIRYICPLLLDQSGVLDVQQICSKLRFPEWTIFHFYIEQTPTSVQKVSPGQALKEGNIVIAQVNKEATALNKLNLEKSINDESIENEQVENVKDQITTELINDSLPDLKNNLTFRNAEFSNESSDYPHQTVQQTSTNLPHHSAEETITDLKTDKLDYFLACRFNLMQFIVYDYESQDNPKYTLDFPASLKFNDMLNVIRKIENFPQSDGILLLFSKDQLYDKAAYYNLTESRFTTQIQNKKFPGSRLYFLLGRSIKTMINKQIYNVEISPDGYNVSLYKTIIEDKLIKPIDLLKIAIQNNDEIEMNTDPNSLRCFSVNNSTIDKKIEADCFIESNFYPIRICKFIKPNVNEVPVRVYHAKIDNQLALTFIKQPFYLNLMDGITVGEFKKKVLDSKVHIDDVVEFLNAKVEVNKIEDHRSSGIFLQKSDDRIIGLKKDCVIYVIYK